jgi:hypothetical protein
VANYSWAGKSDVVVGLAATLGGDFVEKQKPAAALAIAARLRVGMVRK